MEDVVDPLGRPLRECEIGQIPFEELDPLDVIEVTPLAGYEAVGDTHGVPAPVKLFREVRSNESGAAGDEVMSHMHHLSNIRAQPGRPPH